MLRRKTWPVRVGSVLIGSDYPIRLQSMTNTSTLDTDASVQQIIQLQRAGAEIVRLTAQGVAHARNLGVIRRILRRQGFNTPLVADIHFNPAAAFAAAEEVEKVRINPGNFVDPGRTFKKIEYTDHEYAAELSRLRDKFVQFLNICRSKSVAIRIGVNHGSLSDRIMSRYGDTPKGMVESAMEFLRVCVAEEFRDVVISIKASNVVVMTQTVRLLVQTMDSEDMHFPLHLGVTEAGDGEDARVKSAVGIGSLLADGIGDTIRVSLSEDPVNEIPVARALVDYVARRQAEVLRREELSPAADAALVAVNPLHDGSTEPLSTLHVSYPATMTADSVVIAASVDLGGPLLRGDGQAILITAPSMTPQQRRDLAISILQATRRRISKTEYIACPGCGRTLFDLPDVLKKVKQATAHLTGLKIGVMGCIVNGPGEMADADYGYVGGAVGKVSLYKGKQCLVQNIPAEQAIPRLIEIIKDNGDWVDPQS
ncbi:MAG: (E)-4-hydroxy-3-methylbut-2-enyl-diphosphate synthase [Muribaculaceae bacterium]